MIDFQEMAESHGVPVVCIPLPEVRSLSIASGATGVIGLDTSSNMTYAEQQACIGHELGHCLYGGFYSRSSAFDTIERHEIRADRWYIKQAIPRRTLFELLAKGYDVWEIAEILNTTEEYIRRAYYYYKEQM